MKLSLKWLNDYVKINDISAEKLSAKLTMSGSKVETIIKDGGEIENIVIGQVISIRKHENAEKLVVCTVSVGDGKTVEIVTGAQNVVENSFVPVCLENAKLYDGTTIKYQKLRGILSQGMMCSLGELGLLKENFPYAIEDGIFLVEEDCQVGQDIKSAIGLDDTILDFEITSNRPDCLSVYGLAREVAATFSLPLKKNSYDILKNSSEESDVTVEIKTPLCKRYMAMVIEDVEVKPSPTWLRNRLRVCGVKSINNIVDITNYVMLELGVPMHAFDANLIKDKKIIIRNAKNGEKIKTLDNNEYELNEEMVVVCDSSNPISVAGIIGGVDSAINSDTKNIILEVACFSGENIHRTSKILNVKTESALRFEKGLNPICCEETMKRACELILELSAGKITKKLVDCKNFEEKDDIVELDEKFINEFLGINLEKNEMEKILSSLDFEIKNNLVKVPPFRVDIKNKADIAEEIARIYGYDKIPSILPKTASREVGLSLKQKLTKKIKTTAVSIGLFEIYTFSFISPKLYEKMELSKEEILEDSIEIKNPFGEDSSLMRKYLMPSMMQALSLNFRNKNRKVALFEIGRTYKKQGEEIDEQEFLTVGMFGKEYDFFTLKGVVETILESVGVKDFEFVPSKNRFFHPFICCNAIKNDKILATFGEAKPTISENFKISQKTYVANLNLPAIFKASSSTKIYKPISKFPAVSRDLSLVCKDEILSSDIEKQIKLSIGDILEKIEIFDIYRGEQLQKDEKSISFKITMRKFDKTLKDKEVDKKINIALKNLEKIGVHLRNF